MAENGATDNPRDFAVSIVDRIRELAPDEMLGPDSDVTYSWTGGYEKLTVAAIPNVRGGWEYAGAYHPNGYCEGSGICHHCGRTLYD